MYKKPCLLQKLPMAEVVEPSRQPAAVHRPRLDMKQPRICIKLSGIYVCIGKPWYDKPCLLPQLLMEPQLQPSRQPAALHCPRLYMKHLVISMKFFRQYVLISVYIYILFWCCCIRIYAHV